MLTTKGVFKIIALFASVQVAIIITQIIRSKFISIYLGPDGIGLFSVYNSLFSFFFTLIGLGMSQGILNVIPSLIREKLKNVNNYLPRINLFVLTTFLIFCVITFFLKDIISLFFFDNKDFASTVFYLMLGSIFTALATIRMSFIQSYKLNNIIVKIKMLHAIFSTVAAVSLIYFFKYDGILISILIGSVIYYITTLILSYKTLKFDVIIYKNIIHSINEKNFKQIFHVGITLLLGQFVGQIISNYGNLLVLNTGDMSDVGYWAAARTIIVNYAGLIFVALNIEFLPRISSLKNEIKLLKNNIELQLKALNIITLFLSVTLYVFSDLIIEILYSNDFLNASMIIKLASFSIPLNGVTYTLAYLHLIKNYKVKYVILNSIFPGLVFMISGYIFNTHFGIIGLGVTLTFTSVFHYLAVVFYVHKDLSINIKSLFNYNLIISIIILSILLSFDFFEIQNIIYIKALIFITTLIFCVKQYLKSNLL